MGLFAWYNDQGFIIMWMKSFYYVTIVEGLDVSQGKFLEWVAPTPLFRPFRNFHRLFSTVPAPGFMGQNLEGNNRMRKIVEAVTQLAEPLVKEMGCRLWDVEYVKEAGAWFLRVYIDKDGGVSIDDCEGVSRALDPKLDQLDILTDRYTFEVSSAGAERQLKRELDFLQFLGHLAEVRLYQPIFGGKSHVGRLQAYEDGDVVLEMKDGETLRFEKQDIALVRLRIG